MLRKPGPTSLLLLIPLFLLGACVTPQQRARHELDQKGIPFTEDSFIENAYTGDSDALTLFLVAGMKPNATNHDGRSALVVAALAGRETVVAQLLDAGADINARTKEGQTALMGAAVNGSTRIINLLLSRGADMNIKDSQEFTALMYADGANKSEVRELLVKAGAKDWHPGPLEIPEKPIPLPKKQAEKS
jgi:ankyrin repeat protein